MTDIKRVGDSGVFTVEGSVAGSRASRLTKQRDQQKAEYETAKNKIKEQNAAGVGRIDDKFNAATDSLEQEFRRRTVGLVTADDFRKAKEETVEVKSVNEKIMLERQAEATERRKAERAMKRKKSASSLSFSVDDDADNSESAEPLENSSLLVKKTKKDPTVMTSFLPDKDRDMVQRQERERLQQEWLGQQTAIKNEVIFELPTINSAILQGWTQLKLFHCRQFSMQSCTLYVSNFWRLQMLEITYSYWDGIGHRKVIQVRKGTTIGRYLELVKQQVRLLLHCSLSSLLLRFLPALVHVLVFVFGPFHEC